MIAGDDLGIEDGGVRGEAGDAVADFGEAVREVVAIAREDHDPFAAFVQLCPPAVEFDFVNPAVAAWRAALQNRLGR